MSTQQLRRRVEKVEERSRPKHGGMLLWEQFLQLHELFRQDPQGFLEMAKRPDGDE